MTPPFQIWISEGKACAYIVSDGFQEGRMQPAALLNEYIEKISGTALPVVGEPQPGKPTVHLGVGSARGVLGKAALPAGLHPEGFVIVSRGTDLVIAGPTRFGTLNGVSAFLEESLGVRWLAPGDVWEVVPESETIRIGQMRIVQEPDFDIRGVGSGKWALCNRMNYRTGEPDEFRVQWFVHTYLNLVPPKVYLREHPEYFAEIAGKRPDSTMDPKELKKKRWQICTSNPEVVKVAAQTIIDLLDRDPRIRMVSVDPEDSQNTFCQCPACQALLEKDASYEARNTRRCLLFANQVAELVTRKHPNVILKMIAYHTTVAPPVDPTLKPHPSLAIQFCRFMDHNHALHDPASSENRAYFRDFCAWHERTENLLLYEYYNKVSWLHMPWPIVHTLKAEYPMLRRRKILGAISQYGSNHATHGTGYYVAAKLLWDAERDVDALMADFYEKAYGPAASAMRDYHESIERAAIASGVEIAQQRPFVQMLELFTPELLAHFRNCLDRAVKARIGPKELARINDITKGFEHTCRMMDYLGTVAEVRKKIRQPLWAGGADEAIKQEVISKAGPKAEAICAALETPEIRRSVGGMNTYLERALRPERIVDQFAELGGAREKADVRLDKPKWLEEHPETPPAPRTACLELWIYGHDLDYTEDTPEHTLWVRGQDGREVKIGTVGRKGRNGDRKRLCFKLSGLTRELLIDNQLQLKITNEPGGPYASSLFAVYLMPEMPGFTDDMAGEKIEQDIDWVRRHALGFVELLRTGIRCGETAPCTFTIAVPDGSTR